MPPEERAAFLKHLYETLEMRVGTRLAEKMTDQQMTEFEQFINQNDEQGAFRWLEENFPNYKEVVAEEFEKLKHETTQLAPQILASAGQQQPGAGSQVLPQQPYPPQASIPPQHPVQQPPMQPPTHYQPPQHPQDGSHHQAV